MKDDNDFCYGSALKKVVLIYKLLGNPEDLLYDEENPIEISEV